MGIFDSGDDDGRVDEHGCPIQAGEQTIFDHGTSYNSLYYITIAAMAITLVLNISLISMHLRRYRVPKEQRQIVKIIFAPSAFALVSFGCLANYHVAEYISELGEWYSAMVFTCLFLLYIQFTVPDSDFGEGMFQAMHEVSGGGKGGWPKMSWIMVFQYPVTETLAIIILEGTTASGTYCAASLKPNFGHLWTMIIKTVGLALCFITILRFYKKTKPLLKARRGTAKLFGFKGIVAIRFIQTWIFNILIEKGVMKPSKSLSMGDLVYGIPNCMLAIEMVLFGALFWYAYSSTEYSTKARPNYEQLNFFHAMFDAMNPADIIKGVLRIPALLAGRGGEKSTKAYYDGQASYGPINGQHGYNHSLDGAAPLAHGQATYQPPPGPPPFYGRDEEEDPSKRHLFADARSARSPSPRPY